MDVLREAVEFQRTTETTAEFFAKARKMAEAIVSFQWTVEEVEKCLLLNCNNDNETKKEIKMRDIQEKEEIKKIIKKMDEVKSEIKQINAIRPSYASAVQRNKLVNSRVPMRNGPNREQKTCWNCNEVGHVRAQCQKKREVTCFGCGQKGHIRRECHLQCKRCQRPGHRAEECYTKIRDNVSRFNNHEKSDGRTWGQRQFPRNDRQPRTDGRSNQYSNDYNRGIARGRELAALEKEDKDCLEKNEESQVDEEPILAME